MGEPAELSAADRANVQGFARAIIDATADDTGSELTALIEAAVRAKVSLPTALLMMAQELVRLEGDCALAAVEEQLR